STSIPATGLLVLIFFVVGATSMGTAQANNAFGFNSPNIAGFPTGAAELTGGGAYNPATGFVHSGGGFRCIASVQQGPLNGCLAGQGIRWDTAQRCCAPPRSNAPTRRLSRCKPRIH